ncbi:hypothetical protein A33M_2828 [Rhodovulum sp. PH10]|uniref:DUF167 family protein n=1 Tax=Rhodovulum sp. PH10 TaxID=1187851 RepID=UPI00027C1D80|nr:DUF167 family protein [Rhodovulum sp. PH10]EJW13578.1 hypothetical protein A33M_2828 [Rhodovulum sp. PH10]
MTAGDGEAVSTGAAWTAVADGLLVTVRLTPRGGRDALDGVERLADGRAVLKARVRAAPSEGEANAALLALLAKSLGVAKRAATLVAGDTARIKRIKIDGEPDALAATLARLTGAEFR